MAQGARIATTNAVFARRATRGVSARSYSAYYADAGEEDAAPASDVYDASWDPACKNAGACVGAKGNGRLAPGRCV